MRLTRFWSDQVAEIHEFYDYADEHFGWAETAKTDRERAIFLQMAAAWLEVAQQWEAEGAGAGVRTVPESLAGIKNSNAAPEIDNADEIEFWDCARIGLPRTVTDNAKRDGNHGRARKEMQGYDG
jgi:hypothetical protein